LDIGRRRRISLEFCLDIGTTFEIKKFPTHVTLIKINSGVYPTIKILRFKIRHLNIYYFCKLFIKTNCF